MGGWTERWSKITVIRIWKQGPHESKHRVLLSGTFWPVCYSGCSETHWTEPQLEIGGMHNAQPANHITPPTHTHFLCLHHSVFKMVNCYIHGYICLINIAGCSATSLMLLVCENDRILCSLLFFSCSHNFSCLNGSHFYSRNSGQVVLTHSFLYSLPRPWSNTRVTERKTTRCT